MNRRALVLAFLVSFLAFAAGACGTSVPSITGADQKAAEQALAAADLRVGKVTYDRSSTAKTWTVIAQSVKAGEKADGGALVDLTLAGAPPTTVPDLTQADRSRAIARLRTARLRLGKTSRRYHEKIAAGRTIRQEPVAGGQAPEGRPVAIVLSKGKAPIAVSRVVGKDVQRARRGLRKSGFRVKIVYIYSGVRKNSVVSQQPAAGRKLQPGRSVTLRVSKGVELVRVPDVYELMMAGFPPETAYYMQATSVLLANANRRLRPLGLRAVIDNSRIDGYSLEELQSGRIHQRQYPAPGTLVPRGSTIRVESKAIE